MSDPALWKRMHESMWVAFKAVPAASSGRSLELDGVLACVTPAVPERSLPNSVLYESEDALEAALPTLATAYEEAGIDAWTVWVPEHDERARKLLAEAGHTLDATPAAMIAELDEVEPPRAEDPSPDATPSSASWATGPRTRATTTSPAGAASRWPRSSARTTAATAASGGSPPSPRHAAAAWPPP
jgi:hypothetical protein